MITQDTTTRSKALTALESAEAYASELIGQPGHMLPRGIATIPLMPQDEHGTLYARELVVRESLGGCECQGLLDKTGYHYADLCKDKYGWSSTCLSRRGAVALLVRELE